MTASKRQTRIIILLASLAFMTFGSFRLCKMETQRRAIKEDLIELSKIKYGIFSVDEWRMLLAAILTKKVEELELTKAQREEMRVKISNFLTRIINDFETRFRQEKSGSLIGKVQEGIMSATGAFEKMKRDVPVFTEQILDFLAEENNRETAKSFVLEKLNEYTDETFSKIDYTQHDLILHKYNLGDRPATIQGLKVKLNLLRQEELLYILLTFIFFFITIALVLYASRPTTNELLLYILICLVLLRAGLMLPMIEIDARIEDMSFTLFGEPVSFSDQVLYYKSKSILDVVHLMLFQRKWDIKLVGLLVLMFSVLFPISKLCSSLIYITYERAKKSKLIRFLVFRTAKWSMADVMVVAIFMSYIGFSGILTEQLHQLEHLTAGLDIVTTNKSSLQLGFYLFTSFVLLSLLVTHQLQWGLQDRANNPIAHPGPIVNNTLVNSVTFKKRDMETVEQYDTLTEAINALHEQGYTEDFNLKAHCIECRHGEIKLYPHQFEIDKVFRFYGPSDVDDESILYAISSSHRNLKGLLVNGYGASSDVPTQEMIEKLGA